MRVPRHIYIVATLALASGAYGFYRVEQPRLFTKKERVVTAGQAGNDELALREKSRTELLVAASPVPSATMDLLSDLIPPSEPPTPLPALPSVSVTPQPPLSHEVNAAHRGERDEDEDAGFTVLHEIEREGGRVNSNRVGGYRASSAITAATPRASASATPLPRVGGQARGYALLYLMEPAARPAVEKQIEILKKAEIDNIYLGVLVDGTFSTDFDYLNSVLRTLSEDDRKITLELYLTNGATMRKWDTTTIDAGFNMINPDDFREFIKFDPRIRSAFRSLAEHTLPTLDLNLSLNEGNKNYISVMLEDNLQEDSYLAMRELAEPIIQDRATFIRNPCDECWTGNDVESHGDPREFHAPYDPANLRAGDGYTLDGHGYYFPGEPLTKRLSPDAVKQLASVSKARGLAFFGLWREERQGVVGGNPHPSTRTYEVPTDEQAAIEIEMLRSELTPQ